MKKYLIAALSFLAFSNACALSTASYHIHNLQKALNLAQAKMNMKLAFPKEIPASKSNLYATGTANADGSFVISVDSSANCQGAKYCMVGALKIAPSKDPVVYFDANKNQKTVPVNLSNNIQGFYTPGFAMADFWPANIQWKDGKNLYTITWTNADNKNLFVKMANSVIDQSH